MLLFVYRGFGRELGWGHSKEEATCKSGREHLIVYFPAARTRRKWISMCEPPSLWDSVRAAWASQDWFCYGDMGASVANPNCGTGLETGSWVGAESALRCILELWKIKIAREISMEMVDVFLETDRKEILLIRILLRWVPVFYGK